MWIKISTSIAILICLQVTLAQENAQTRIPQSLMECYSNPDILERDNRLPSNINMLVEIIRKIEDTPGINLDMRQMALALLHRFRLDGIERARGVTHASVIPFSPSGFQFSKHRLLLSRMIPGNAVNFPNSTLTSFEHCALHFMLSSSIETQVRNDEAQRCSQLAPIRALRIPRELRDKRGVPIRSNFKGDVELMEELKEYRSHSHRKGNLQMLDEDVTAADEGAEIDVAEREGGAEYDEVGEAIDEGIEQEAVDTTFVGTQTNVISQCPVENGVLRTAWGAISGGPLIAGIATGMDHQNIQIRDLLAISRVRNQQNARQTQLPVVDNRWAATLAGDLAEVALLQGPVMTQVQVGAIGGWNSSLIPRWYFLSQRERFEMTDAEIRGGLDGLILALNVVNYRSQAPSMRLSQLIDMYYSQRGVFSTNARACDRRTLFTEVAPVAEIQAQTRALSVVLDREMQLVVTLSDDAIQQFSQAAAQSLSTYVPTVLNDLSCAATSLNPNDATIWRTATRILIYLDTTYTFMQISPAISHLLENLDVNRFGTTYTLMNANDGTIIVNTTNVLSDFYMQYNNTVHLAQPTGLNLPSILNSVRSHSTAVMNEERTNSTVASQSMVTLIIANTAGVTEGDSNFAFEQIVVMREQVPDMTLLFLAGGTASRFNRFVREPSRDIFPLQLGTGVGTITGSVNPLIQRIQDVPRRIINHRCGADWWTDQWGGNTINQYVERGGINFYRLHPNYFFRSGDNRRVRIHGHGYSTVIVCHSRWTALPRQNGTNQSSDVTCQQIDSQTIEIPLVNACDGHFLIQQCPSLYISVEGIASAAVSTFRCVDDAECRFPDNIRFGINVENLGCFSSARQIFGAFALVIVSVFFAMHL